MIVNSRKVHNDPSKVNSHKNPRLPRAPVKSKSQLELISQVYTNRNNNKEKYARLQICVGGKINTVGRSLTNTPFSLSPNHDIRK